MSVRTGAETDTFQNRVSALLADLATNEADPVKRLRRVQESMTSAKEDFKAIPAETLQDYSQFSPPAVAARAMRMYSRLRIADRMNPPFNLIISNVPGPTTPLYSAGARLRHFYPVSAIADGQGLNMTVQSYNGNLDFGFISCRELVPDLWTMADHLQASMQELLGAARAATGEAAPASPPTVAAKPSGTRTATRAKRAATKRAATDTTTPARRVAARPSTTKAASGTRPAAPKQAATRAPSPKKAAARKSATRKTAPPKAAATRPPAPKRAAASASAGSDRGQCGQGGRHQEGDGDETGDEARVRRGTAASNGSPAAGSRTRVAAASAT